MFHTLGLVIQTLSTEAVESLKTFEQEREVVLADFHEYTSSSMFSVVFSGTFLLLCIVHKTYVILR